MINQVLRLLLTPRMVASPRSFTSVALTELSLLLLIPSGRDGLRTSPEEDIRRVTVGLVGVSGDFGAIGGVGVGSTSGWALSVGAKSTIAK